MQFNIRIASSEDAQKLNAVAQQLPFDVWVHGKSGYADAKSMLGLTLFILETELKLVVEDDADTRRLEKEIEPFIVK
jgi:hypothetical protein